MIFSNKIIELKEFKPNLINYINDIVKNNGFVRTILVFESTRGMTSEYIKMIKKSSKLKFRITGGFDFKKNKSKNKKLEEEYIESITYTKEELFSILSIMEKLELSINKEYEQIEKALFIYDSLRRYFSYKCYKKTIKKESESLRCLINKNISARGVALIYKELLYRQGIYAYCVEGKLITGDIETFHAWNILDIENKFCPVDLYLDIMEIRRQYRDMPMFFGETIAFSKSHIPGNSETVQVYDTSLFKMTDEFLKEIFEYIKDNKISSFSVNILERTDGTEGLFSFLGKEKFRDKLYEKIIYFDFNNDSITNPSILYVDADIKIVDNQMFVNNALLKETDLEIIYNKLLSSVNIRTGLTLNNGYIGTLNMNSGNLEILFDNEVKINIKSIQKNFIRSDKTIITLEKLNEYKYKIYEITHDERYYVEEYILYTEKDIMGNDSQEFINEVFSRENILNAVKYKGGYLGYFNPSEVKLIEKKEEN